MTGVDEVPLRKEQLKSGGDVVGDEQGRWLASCMPASISSMPSAARGPPRHHQKLNNGGRTKRYVRTSASASDSGRVSFEEARRTSAPNPTAESLFERRLLLSLLDMDEEEVEARATESRSNG